MRHVRFLTIGIVVSVMFSGCPQPDAVPPQDAPWLDAEQQIALLKEKDIRLRTLAARNLGKLGAEAAKAIPDLERLTTDPNAKVSQTARESLEKIRAALNESGE